MSFRKALKHKNNSETLDEKIAKANKEYQKTGIVIKEEPTNSTSGFYVATSNNPEIPAVFADVPDPSGVLDINFTQPVSGDPDDPANWPDAYSDNSWISNPNDVDGESNRPIFKSLDKSLIDAFNTAFPDNNKYPDPAGGGGIVFGNIAFGTAVGYASGGQFRQILSPGLFGNGSVELALAFEYPYFGLTGQYFPIAGEEEARVIIGMSYAWLDTPGYTTDPSKVMEIELWRQHSTFHDGQWDNWSGKKYQNNQGNRYVLQKFYMHRMGNSYEKTPKVPASTTILYRTGPSDPLFQKIGKKVGETLKKLFELSREALDSFMPNMVQSFGMPIQIATSVGKNEPVNVPEPSNSEKQEFFDNLDPNLLFNPNDPANITPSGQPIQVAGFNGIPINDNKQPYSDDNFYIDPDTGKVTPHTTESKTKFPPNTGPQSIQSTIGGRGQAQSQVYQNENGEWVFSYEDHAYDNLNTWDPDETVGVATKASEMAHVAADEKFGRNNGEVQFPGSSYETKKPDNTSPNTGAMSDYPCNSTACIRGDSILKFEIKVSDIENDDVRNKILSEIEKGKGNTQNENYIRESKKVSKISKIKLPGPDDELTVKAIDMIKLHKLNEYEIRQYVEIVGKINQWIRENPKEYEIWKVRYPANDPRLAELNWKLDSQLRASDEYMETNFPENEKLYKKLQKKIKGNIEKTDPKRIDTSVPVVSEEDAMIARKRRLNVLERYKKQVDIKPFFNKKTPEIDWKIDYLNKELAKNGIDEAMRTYTIYQGAKEIPNEVHTDFAVAAFGGRSLGYSGMDNVEIGGAKVGAVVASEVGLSPGIPSHDAILNLSGVAQSPINPNTGQRTIAYTRTGMVQMSPARPGQDQGTQGNTTGSIVWYWDANANNPNGTQGAWRQLQFFPGSDGGGYWAVWGSNFLGFTVPRPDLVPAQISGIFNNIGISNKGTVGTPQTTVFTQNRLDDPGFMPINIGGLSNQGYNYLKDKADGDFIAGIYDLMKRGQVPFLTPSQVDKILVDPKYQKLLQDDPDILPILQRMRAMVDDGTEIASTDLSAAFPSAPPVPSDPSDAPTSTPTPPSPPVPPDPSDTGKTSVDSTKDANPDVKDAKLGTWMSRQDFMMTYPKSSMVDYLNSLPYQPSDFMTPNPKYPGAWDQNFKGYENYFMNGDLSALGNREGKPEPRNANTNVVPPRYVAPASAAKPTGFLDSILSAGADAVGRGAAKDVFDYYMDKVEKGHNGGEHNINNLLGRSTRAIEKWYARNKTNLVTARENGKSIFHDAAQYDFQHLSSTDGNLKNITGNLDFARGDGIFDKGDTLEIVKHYDFDGERDLAGGGVVGNLGSKGYAKSKGIMKYLGDDGTGTSPLMKLVITIDQKTGTVKTSVKESLDESVKLGHFEPEALTVDLDKLRKGILPEFPKDPPPKLINGYSEKSKLLPKVIEGEPFIKITKKDLARNHRLKDSEIKKFMAEINMINDYIKNNPEQLVHAMQRYPKHDPRLAQLNWEMDQKLQASENYMETHFPENEKLFNKLQTKINQNIEVTDPKNFTGHKEAPKFDQTDISEQERRRRVIIRHFNKKKNKKLEESNWKPTTGSIANSTSQTFTYSSPNFETGEPNTFTTSGLSGVEAQQQSVKVNLGFGETENVSPPSYNQLSLAGYAKPILLRKRDPEEVNPKLDASQEFTKKNNSEVMMNARVDKGKGVGNSGISKDDADKLISSAGKFSKELQTFLNYLFNKGPKIIDNNYLGRNHVLKLFKDGFINDKGNFAVDDFIVGSGQKLTFNPNTGQYSVKFTYNFDDNATEIFKNPDKYRFMPGIHPKNFFLNARVILGGNYGLDALGIPGRLIEISKAFGGGQSKSGEITISPKDLMAQNPKLAQNYIQQKFGLTGPVWSPRMMGSPQGSNPSVTHNYYALHGKLPPRSVRKGSVPMNFGDHPEYDPNVIAKIREMRKGITPTKDKNLPKDVQQGIKNLDVGFDRGLQAVSRRIRRKKKS